MKKTDYIKIVFVVSFVFATSMTIGCSKGVPRSFDATDDLPAIYPDYVETTFPPNIAPANFQVEEEADDYFVKLSGEDGSTVCVSGRKAIFPEKKWRRLLESNRGGKFSVDVFVKINGKWLKRKTFENRVSDDPVDPYLSYRLIEPGYDYGHRIVLAQRCVENYDERAFFDNRSVGTSPCVNCHSFQDRKTDRFLFHFRRMDAPPMGGTIIVEGKNIKKVGGQVEANKITCSYPAWRPTGDLVAFSSNYTRQVFHALSSQKIEVFDAFSDLVLLDATKNELTLIESTKEDFEVFPYWSPDGSFLYYCSAHFVPETPQSTEKDRLEEMAKRATELRYSIYRRSFDESSRTFGSPEIVVDAAGQERSALFPRISPDGKFLVYTLAESGVFPIWRPEAQLYIKNLETGEEREWKEVNSDDSDSYHSWSSTGRWIVFSSRREDGQYTRLYMAHVDAEGNATKPFTLPQKDPEHGRRLLKSYNVPEPTVEPIKVDPRELLKVAEQPAEPTKNL